jgi:hypothetical protein
MHSRALVLLLVVAATAGGGAALPDATTPQAPQGILDRFLQGGLKVVGGLVKNPATYVRNRLWDAADIFELNLGIGLGLKAGVEYGIGRTALGRVEAQRIGFDGRQVGAWVELDEAFGIFPASLAFLPLELLRGAGEGWKNAAVVLVEVGTIGMEHIARDRLTTSSVLYHEALALGPWHERPGDICALGAEVHAGLLGLRARAKPLELVDFVLGFVGIELDGQLGHPQPYRQARKTR